MTACKLNITRDEGDIVEVYLNPHKHPVAYQAKKQELMQSGMSEKEADEFLLKIPFIMELFYSPGQGLFAVESEPLSQIEIYNPYQGYIIPNENLNVFSPDPLGRIDGATCEMENIRDEIRLFYADEKLTVEGEEVIENLIDHLNDALEQIHKFTDPDEKGVLYDFGTEEQTS